MTNSKQYCSYCWERYTPQHENCRLLHNPYVPKYKSLFTDATLVSKVLVKRDKQLLQIFPEGEKKIYSNESEWKTCFPEAIEANPAS